MLFFECTLTLGPECIVLFIRVHALFSCERVCVCDAKLVPNCVRLLLSKKQFFLSREKIEINKQEREAEQTQNRRDRQKHERTQQLKQNTTATTK